jgi:hypothetical protein
MVVDLRWTQAGGSAGRREYQSPWQPIQETSAHSLSVVRRAIVKSMAVRLLTANALGVRPHCRNSEFHPPNRTVGIQGSIPPNQGWSVLGEYPCPNVRRFFPQDTSGSREYFVSEKKRGGRRDAVKSPPLPELDASARGATSIV